MNERFSLDGGYIGKPLFLILIFAESYDVNILNNPSLSLPDHWWNANKCNCTKVCINSRDLGVDSGEERWHVDEFSDSLCTGECHQVSSESLQSDISGIMSVIDFIINLDVDCVFL